MKRAITLLLAAILLMVLMGCNRIPGTSIPVETEVPYAFDYERLWTFDPGQPGFARTGAGHQITWNNEDVNLAWGKTPREFVVGGNNNFEKRVEKGVTYYFKESEITWDGTDANQKWISGMNFTRSIHFEQDDYRYGLSASASRQNASLEAVSIETALELTVHPGLLVPGYGKTTEGWSTSFQNSNISLSITISPPPFDQQEFDRYLAEDGSVSMTAEDGLQYISSGRERSAEDPMIVCLFARTEIGTVSVRGGVPYLERNNVPADSLDFITLDLVRAVTAWIRGG